MAWAAPPAAAEAGRASAAVVVPWEWPASLQSRKVEGKYIQPQVHQVAFDII